MSLHGTRGNNSENRLMAFYSTKGVLDRYSDGIRECRDPLLRETSLTLRRQTFPSHAPVDENREQELGFKHLLAAVRVCR